MGTVNREGKGGDVSKIQRVALEDQMIGSGKKRRRDCPERGQDSSVTKLG